MSEEFILLLLKEDITPDEFILLKCIGENNTVLLNMYMEINGVFPVSSVYKLEKLGFIKIKSHKSYTLDGITTSEFSFQDLNITEKTLKTFGNNLQSKEENDNFEELFEELLSKYPKTVAGRRLHVEKNTCKKLYKAVINPKTGVLKKDLHQLILRCIDYEQSERRKNNKTEYTWQLVRYIRQQEWNTYKEEVLKYEGEISGERDNKTEDI
jgi:hypothetical protein